MIKRANQKKKKGFSLIELIIVLAVMAIIALIAIPNFTAVRENSKKKADKQSCETIERAMLMLTADETIEVSTATVFQFTVATNGTPGTVTSPAPTTSTEINTTEATAISKALAEVNKPQSTTSGIYYIKIDPSTGKVTVDVAAIS